jgi:predicted proteasome-type protease
VLSRLRDHVRRRYEEWFPSVPAVPAPALAGAGQVPTRPDLTFLVSGYEVDENGKALDSKIYQIASTTDFAPNLHDYGFAVAGVAPYAWYLLNRLYEGNRSITDLVALAVYAITETASQDGKVGGPVNVVTISADAGCRILTSHEVDKIIEINRRRSGTLRRSFYGSNALE